MVVTPRLSVVSQTNPAQSPVWGRIGARASGHRRVPKRRLHQSKSGGSEGSRWRRFVRLPIPKLDSRLSALTHRVNGCAANMSSEMNWTSFQNIIEYWTP